MTRQKIVLALATAAFLGWLIWLALAVAGNGAVPVVSRAQMTSATVLVVATLKTGSDGLPEPTATVQETIRGDGPPGGTTITVANLPKTIAAGTYSVPGEGLYLLPLVRAEAGQFKIAGLPKSPGYENLDYDRPPVYPWTDDVKKQLRTLNLLP